MYLMCQTGGPMAVRAKSLSRLLGKLPELEKVLRGSLVTRYRSCGKAGCHCAREGDRGHGPAYYLMVTVGPGKTTSIYIPARHVEQVEAYLQNFRRAREILEADLEREPSEVEEGDAVQGRVACGSRLELWWFVPRPALPALRKRELAPLRKSLYEPRGARGVSPAVNARRSPKSCATC